MKYTDETPSFLMVVSAFLRMGFVQANLNI